MTFRWCEKESKENKSSWLQNDDYKPKKNIETRLLDGYGIIDNRGIAVMIESSNVTHYVRDSIKQIKNATDFLTYLKSRFQVSSARTFTELRTPTLLLIRNQLTMATTSLDWNGKWQVVGVRTATVPNTKKGNFNMVKVFELLFRRKKIWKQKLWET